MAKYSYYSDIDPEFAAIREEVDKNYGAIWDLPLAEVKDAWENIPPALGPYVPNDLDIHNKNIPVRDGYEVDVRIYKSKNTPDNASLYVVAHGGGWCVGTHGVEEAMNRIVADKTPTVVVSVNYRL
jgi:acetyl esterase/lipase